MSNTTTTKIVSQHAQVAKIIRTYLKTQGLKGRVSASGTRGATSVSVGLINASPAQVADVKQFVLKYKYGRFNGMTDGYDMTNSRDDIPQVAYIWVEGRFDDEHKQRALDSLSARFDLPAMSVDAIPTNLIVMCEPTNMYVAMTQVLCGSHSPHIKFWADDSEEECEVEEDYL